MVNIGDKYIIEVSGVFKNEDQRFGKPLYKMMHFNSLVFDEEGISRLTPYEPNNDENYQRGLNDAWEVAKKICGHYADGGMGIGECKKAFGTAAVGYIVALPIGEVMSMLTKYEAKKKAEEEIKVGDEITVSVHNPERTLNVIVYGVSKCGSSNVYDTLSLEEGECFGILWYRGIKKTGRHFPQVEELLSAMKGG